MLNRATNSQKQAFTRCVRHGNTMNKRGVAAHFQTAVKNQREPIRARKFKIAPTIIPPMRQYGDMTVRPPAPKAVMPIVEETRFTIPNVTGNANIYEQVMIRSHDSYDDVLHELRSCLKIHSFAVDQDHDIQVVLA